MKKRTAKNQLSTEERKKRRRDEKLSGKSEAYDHLLH